MSAILLKLPDNKTCSSAELVTIAKNTWNIDYYQINYKTMKNTTAYIFVSIRCD